MWKPRAHPLQPVGQSGIWEGFLPGIEKGTVYKYHVTSLFHGYTVDKADPFAVRQEVPPRTGSIVWDLDYRWRDSKWLAAREGKQRSSEPMSIYRGIWVMAARARGPQPHADHREARARWPTRSGMGFTPVELFHRRVPVRRSWG